MMRGIETYSSLGYSTSTDIRGRASDALDMRGTVETQHWLQYRTSTTRTDIRGRAKDTLDMRDMRGRDIALATVLTLPYCRGGASDALDIRGRASDALDMRGQ